MPLEKATIVNLETGRQVKVLFNPGEYSIKRDNNFVQSAIPGLSSPVTQFVAGNMRTLEMELFIDTYVDERPGSDARVVADQIISLMDILPETHAPPRLEFGWGSLRFQCVLASASSTFQLFREDGTPVRMRVQVTFNEYRDPRVEAREIKRETADFPRLRVVTDADTITAIAAAEYRDPRQWRPIALMNEIVDPADLEVGRTLHIPALPYRDTTGRVFSVTDQYAPDYRLYLDGRPISADLRGAITSVAFTSALEGADRVEIGVANQYLRWTDDPALEPGVPMTLLLGYNPDDFEQIFVGEVVSVQASFPADGLPTLMIAGQDRFERLRESPKSRWFAVPVPFLRNGAIPDPAIAAMVSAEHGLVPIIDPVGAALSIILYGASVVVSVVEDAQVAVRQQEAETDLDFLQRVASENGWELFIDHSDPLGGRKLRFMSPLDELDPIRTYPYGASLMDWSPRITTVGVIVSVTAFLRVPATKTVFQVTVGYDWDRGSLDISIQPATNGELPAVDETSDEGGDGKPTDRSLMIEENLSLVSAPRRILSELIPSLNGRVTGSGSVVGDPALIAGRVVQLEGLGREFGGRYRITSATHTIDSSGYRTTFDGRKEIWFGSIPALDQGAVALQTPFIDLEGVVAQ